MSTTATATPPFRADHVGSLLRPPALTRGRAEFKAGRIDAEALRAVEDAAILEVIELQRDVGLQFVTDGELRRTSWHMDFIYQLDGITPGRGRVAARAVPQRARAPTTTRRRRCGWPARSGSGETIFADAFTFLRDHAARRTDAEADDPLAEHGPLPRRQRVDRPRRLPRPRRVLGRPGRRLREASSRRLRARLPLPAARRHQPRVRQRPGAARRTSRRSAAIPTHLHEQYIAQHQPALAGRPRTWPSPPTSAAATTSRCGPPRAATTSSPRRCSAI